MTMPIDQSQTGYLSGAAAPATQAAQSHLWMRLICVLCTVLSFSIMIAHPATSMAAYLPVFWKYLLAKLVFLAAVFVIYFTGLRLFHPDVRSLPGHSFYKYWFRDYFRRRRIINMLFALMAMTLSLSAFTVHKTLVFRALPFTHDPWIIEADKWLFFGTDPWKVTHALFSSPWATMVLDRLYHPFFLPMALGYIIGMVIISSPRLRHAYIATYLLSWLFIGMLMARAMMSAGPAFDGVLIDTGGRFLPLLERLRDQAAQNSWIDVPGLQEYLQTVYYSDYVAFGSGISAMPSMHISMAVLWAIPAWYAGRLWGLLFSAYALLMWLASIHLAWHYALDGVVAGAVTLAIWFAVYRLVALPFPGIRPDP